MIGNEGPRSVHFRQPRHESGELGKLVMSNLEARMGKIDSWTCRMSDMMHK